MARSGWRWTMGILLFIAVACREPPATTPPSPLLSEDANERYANDTVFRSRVPFRGAHGSTSRTHPNRDSEEAVLNGLRWLARHQGKDGSWRSRDDSHAVGSTALCVLAFLGDGYGPDSKQYFIDPFDGAKYELARITRSALDFVLAHEEPDGSFRQDDALHANGAVATLALCEVLAFSQSSSFSSNESLRDGAQRAINHLATVPREPVVNGIVALALFCARRARLHDPPRARELALGIARHDPTVDVRLGSAAAAASACARIFLLRDLTEVRASLGVERRIDEEELPVAHVTARSFDYAYWHFATLARFVLFESDAPTERARFEAWMSATVETILALQHGVTGSRDDGGWLVEDRVSRECGPVYSTALNVLTLETYERYTNVTR